MGGKFKQALGAITGIGPRIAAQEESLYRQAAARSALFQDPAARAAMFTDPRDAGADRRRRRAQRRGWRK